MQRDDERERDERRLVRRRPDAGCREREQRGERERERRRGKIQVVSSPIIRPVVALLRPKPGSRDEVPTYEDFASCTLTPPMSTLPPTHGSFTK